MRVCGGTGQGITTRNSYSMPIRLAQVQVCVPIQPPALADGDFRQRAEDRRLGAGADLQGLVRKRAGASESGEIQMTCANRIGKSYSIARVKPGRFHRHTRMCALGRQAEQDCAAFRCNAAICRRKRVIRPVAAITQQVSLLRARCSMHLIGLGLARSGLRVG